MTSCIHIYALSIRAYHTLPKISAFSWADGSTGRTVHRHGRWVRVPFYAFTPITAKIIYGWLKFDHRIFSEKPEKFRPERGYEP